MLSRISQPLQVALLSGPRHLFEQQSASNTHASPFCPTVHPALHTPPEHVSPNGHSSGSVKQPIAGSQLSVVQASPSPQNMGSYVQAPASQESVVQAFPSLHIGTLLQTPLTQQRGSQS